MAPVAIPVYSESKAPASFAALSPDEMSDLLAKRMGLYDYLLANERPHVLSGKRPNLPGLVLYLFEHEGRDTTIPVLMADGNLSERSVLTGLSKLNELLWAVFNLQIVHDKETGEVRLSDLDAAKEATDRFLDRFTKAQREFTRTMTAFEQVDPVRARSLIDQNLQQRLAAGAMTQKQADEVNGFRRALAPAASSVS